MYPLNDKDLDRLSRESAEQYDVESSASGWERLEKRLDKELPVKDDRDRKRFLLWLFLIALGSGGGLVWLLRGNNPSGSNNLTQNTVTGHSTEQTVATKDKNITRTDNQSNSSDRIPSANPANTNHNNPADAGTQTDQNNAIRHKTVTQPDIVTTNPDRDNARQDIQKTLAGNNSVKVKKSQDADRNIPVSNNQLHKNRQPVAKNADQPVQNPKPVTAEPVITGKDQPVNNRDNNAIAKTGTDKNNQVSNNQVTAPEKDQAITGKNNPAADKPVTDVAVTDKNADINKTSDQLSKQNAAVTDTDKAAVQDSTQTAKAEQSPANKNKGTTRSPWSIGLVTGPDFSNVKFTHHYRTGLNIGLLGEYRLSNRWSFSTGLIYTKKFYMADGQDFHPPKHSRVSYLDVYMVKGNCSMFEVPVNARYDFKVGKQNRYFVSTGLSTYFMKNEYYDYYYNWQGTNMMINWESDSASHYMLSVLGISAGFEHNLGKRFSILAEPYFKVPLRGLGYGSMKLDSYGVYFSLKYNFARKRK